MPIHNLGYREWDGELESPSTRWTVVAAVGIRRAWQSTWVRRMMFIASMPAVAMGVLIFVFEQSEKNDGPARDIFRDLSRAFLEQEMREADVSPRDLINSLTASQQSVGEMRHTFWSLLLLNLFRRSQPFILIPLIGVIGPPLISQDIRSRAFLLYFSRPLGKVQYIAGKAATIMSFLLIITLVPALLLILAGVLLSPELSILTATWDLPLRALVASALITIPSTCIALALSSLTTESRFASFGWFAIWIFGAITYQAVVPFGQPGSRPLIECVSLFHLFSDVAGWVLDAKLAVQHIGTRLVVLAVITGVSLAIVYRRVSAPMKV